jgi:Na+/H+-translocating membrane pyrophosphatase
VPIGLALASGIQLLTGYCTENTRRPTREISRSSLTGAATMILSGVSVGLEGSVYSVLLRAAAVFGAFALGLGNVTLALFAVPPPTRACSPRSASKWRWTPTGRPPTMQARRSTR